MPKRTGRSYTRFLEMRVRELEKQNETLATFALELNAEVTEAKLVAASREARLDVFIQQCMRLDHLGTLDHWLVAEMNRAWVELHGYNVQVIRNNEEGANTEVYFQPGPRTFFRALVFVEGKAAQLVHLQLFDHDRGVYRSCANYRLPERVWQTVESEVITRVEQDAYDLTPYIPRFVRVGMIMKAAIDTDQWADAAALGFNSLIDGINSDEQSAS